MLLWPILFACTNEDVRVLESWEGVYEVQQMRLGESSCEPGPDIEPDPPFFEVDTAAGVDAHLIALRPCEGRDDCLGIPWFEAVVVDPKPKTLEGDLADYSFAGIEGTCLVQWVGLRLTRANESAKGLEVEIEVHRDTTSAEDEQACVDFMSATAADDDCDDFFVLDAERVR